MRCRLQKIEHPEVVTGWTPAENRIIYSTTGYGTESEKSAIVRVNGHKGRFQLVDNISNSVVYEGSINAKENRYRFI